MRKNYFEMFAENERETVSYAHEHLQLKCIMVVRNSHLCFAIVFLKAVLC